MNRVELVGRLTRDPVLRYTPSNRPVAQFTLAVNRRYAKETDEIKADFFTIIAWGKQGENCKTYLFQGSQAGVTGELRNRSYTDRDGNTRYVTEVLADSVEFLSSKRADSPTSNNEPIPPQEEETTPYSFQGEQSSLYDEEYTLSDDDLPF